MRKNIYLFSCIALIITACSSTKEAVKYTVASKTVNCIGEGPQKCLLIKKGNIDNWEYFYSSIEGFNYEEGFEYVLRVKENKIENPPAGRSSFQYILVKEISKIKKESENLPSAIPSSKVAKYQWGGKILSIEETTIGQGAATGKFPVTILKIEVIYSSTDLFKAKDIIHAEIALSSKTRLIIGHEYVFKATDIHPAHAKGIYMLNTEVIDLL